MAAIDSKVKRPSEGPPEIKEYRDLELLALKHRWDTAELNCKYTFEERKDLACMLRERKGFNSHADKLQAGAFELTRESLSSDEFALLFLPLDEMPLYVNHMHHDFEVIAAWRLKWAK
jgi:hypothetical protein